MSALLDHPRGARALIALAHGAGAGMRHGFMEAVSARLVSSGIAVFRYQFPYMEAGRRAPDPPSVLTATVRAA
ncbi:MAG TPA: alpha/beta family hydrolase, partial [Myxococcota bacterium]|nr:alpha/beta family hydrolase [Myxococcota bacterium]